VTDNHLLEIIRPFFEICLLRLRPQDLPESTPLLGLVLIGHTFSAVLLSTVALPFWEALLAGLLDTLLLAAMTLSVLHLQRLQNRLKQTLTALAGTGTLIGMVAIPLSNWLHMANETNSEAVTPALLLLLLIGWSLTVTGHILRHALSTAFIMGLVLAMVFYWITINILNAIFPVTI
jgi:predicted signal transduction protein with EAL and GGDEF domain